MSDVRIDARGLVCPLPVIALARAAAAHPPGSVVRLLADDPAAEADIPAWCRLKGAELLEVIPADDGALAYRVRTP